MWLSRWCLRTSSNTCLHFESRFGNTPVFQSQGKYIAEELEFQRSDQPTPYWEQETSFSCGVSCWLQRGKWWESFLRRLRQIVSQKDSTIRGLLPWKEDQSLMDHDHSLCHCSQPACHSFWTFRCKMKIFQWGYGQGNSRGLTEVSGNIAIYSITSSFCWVTNLMSFANQFIIHNRRF